MNCKSKKNCLLSLNMALIELYYHGYKLHYVSAYIYVIKMDYSN